MRVIAPRLLTVDRQDSNASSCSIRFSKVNVIVCLIHTSTSSSGGGDMQRAHAACNNDSHSSFHSLCLLIMFISSLKVSIFSVL